LIESYKNRGEFADKMLYKYFSISPNSIVSDIGVGFGHMKNSITSLGGIWQPFDYVKKIDETILWDLNENAPKNAKKAGTVVFLEVLEHLANPLLALENISDHTENGGYLIMTTPNPQCSKNSLNLILKGQMYVFQTKHLKEHHVFTPWEHIVQFFLENCGFEILEYAIIDTSYHNRRTTSLKGFIKRKIESLIEWKNPKAKGLSYGIVAKKIK
jgi:2-polyprenyl-3-methyl-5-hydroxy-6-metoxy-1,4-benzoquinol methylase